MKENKLLQEVNKDISQLAIWLDGMKGIGSLHKKYDDRIVFYIRLGSTITWCEEMTKRLDKIMTKEDKKKLLKLLKKVVTT